MWRFTRNYGITEGFHNNMELINRQAYGFRNFQNYRNQFGIPVSPVVGVESP
jgi:transposase